MSSDLKQPWRLIMNHAITIIAKYTYLEAIRNRIFWFVITGLICAYGMSRFIGEISIIEREQIELSILGAGLRLFIVFTSALFLITSVVREMNDKCFDLILSHPVARSSYFFGKMIGFGMMSVVLSCLAGLILLSYGALLSTVCWVVSLVCELLIINALAMLCLLTFSNITLSFAAVSLFYLLSRLMDTIQLISDSPIIQSDSFSQAMIGLILDGIAYLLPDLSRFSKTAWLVYEDVSLNMLYPVFIQTIIYLLLLSAVALFDLYRKEL